jgi:hypothetical protein
METHTHLGSGSLILGFATAVCPLSITFLDGGRRVSEVRFAVRDRHGNTVLRAVSDGSFLRLRLPPGGYRVSARLGGRTLQRDVEVVASGNSHLAFNFA